MIRFPTFYLQKIPTHIIRSQNSLQWEKSLLLGTLTGLVSERGDSWGEMQGVWHRTSLANLAPHGYSDWWPNYPCEGNCHLCGSVLLCIILIFCIFSHCTFHMYHLQFFCIFIIKFWMNSWKNLFIFSGTLTNDEDLLEFAKLGCYCQFDLFGTECSFYQLNPSLDMLSDAQRVDKIARLISEGRADHLLMSHDIHTKHRLVGITL